MKEASVALNFEVTFVMAPASESAYFNKARLAGRPVVQDLPKFDLDAYIANYRGKTSFLGYV